MYYNTLLPLLEHTRTIYKTSYHLVLIFHLFRIAKKRRPTTSSGKLFPKVPLLPLSGLRAPLGCWVETAPTYETAEIFHPPLSGTTKPLYISFVGGGDDMDMKSLFPALFVKITFWQLCQAARSQPIGQPMASNIASQGSISWLKNKGWINMVSGSLTPDSFELNEIWIKWCQMDAASVSKQTPGENSQFSLKTCWISTSIILWKSFRCPLSRIAILQLHMTGRYYCRLSCWNWIDAIPGMQFITLHQS